MNRDILSATVEATNLANRFAIQIRPTLIEFYAQYLNKKVVKADGSLIKKIYDHKFSHMGFNLYRIHSQYSIDYEVKVDVHYSSSCVVYRSTTVHVGTLDRDTGVLVKIADLIDVPKLRTNYTVEEVLQKREVLRKAQNVLDEAKSALFPFGEYDR